MFTRPVLGAYAVRRAFEPRASASMVVPDSFGHPLAYYRNNTVNSRALIESAVKGGANSAIPLEKRSRLSKNG